MFNLHRSSYKLQQKAANIFSRIFRVAVMAESWEIFFPVAPHCAFQSEECAWSGVTGTKRHRGLCQNFVHA